MPAAVASAVPNHQSWRAPRSAAAAPGSSGAIPKAGATPVARKPAIAQGSTLRAVIARLAASMPPSSSRT